MSKGFEYKIFDLADVIHFTADRLPDAYFAAELTGRSKEDWDAAIGSGYRWIRTDGALVILEREYDLILGRKFQKK